MPIVPEWAIAPPYLNWPKSGPRLLLIFASRPQILLQIKGKNDIQNIFGTKITVYFTLDALAILIFDQQVTDLRASQPLVMVVIHFS